MFHELPGQQKSDDSEQSDDEVDAPHEYLSASVGQNLTRLAFLCSIGPIRAAVLLGILQTPRRFRTKRQLWTYGGVGIETHSSADHRVVDG